MSDADLILIENQDYRGQSFRDEVKSGIKYVKCNFAGADLENCRFENCRFENCNFRRANLKGVEGIYFY